MSGAACVAHAVLDPRVWDGHFPNSSCPSSIVQAYQYPSIQSGSAGVSSHQVVLRGPRTLDESSQSEQDLEAWRYASDLHVDRWDGGGALGTCTIHTCLPRIGGASQNLKLRFRDLVVFPRMSGGRGVRLRSMVPGWCCAIFMQTSTRLHGGVAAQFDEIKGLALEEYEMMRVVTYPVSNIERLLDRLSRDPDGLRRLAAATDQHLLERMCRFGFEQDVTL